MAYNINKFNGDVLVVLEDGTIDTSTSIGLVGRNYVGYGETQNENFVYLLENFANENPPSRPLVGQIWFNTTNSLAYSYNGASWSLLGAAVVDATAPESPSTGALWIDTASNQLKYWAGTSWEFIGPEAVAGFGITRARSTAVLDSLGNRRPVVLLEIDDEVTAICTNEAFTLDPSSTINGFDANLIAGINLSSSSKIKGNITGNAGSADRLSTTRTINGVGFDGQSNITVKASTTNRLLKGDYVSGSNFDGSAEVTWGVDATPSNVIGKVVARNSEGGFSAGTISATFVGNLTGNVVAATGTSTFNIVEANTFVGTTLTGNAYTATRFETPRKINGINFDGSADVTITAAANTLTGTTLASNVTLSGLTQVGTLSSLDIAGAINFTNGLQITSHSAGVTTITDNTLQLVTRGATNTSIAVVDGVTNLSAGGNSNTIGAVLPGAGTTTDLGNSTRRFNNVYAELKGNADTASVATKATNIAGGGAGALPYQTAANTTGMLGLGTDGYVLRARPDGPNWEALAGLETLTKGTYLNFVNTITSGTETGFDGTESVTISVDATSANTASKVVARDSSGNFSAGTITANLTGNVTGNASTATKLATPRNINGVAFDGTTDITVVASDATKVAKAGDSMTGYLTLNGNPTAALHAAPKQYVDSRLPQYVFTSGNTEYAYSYTNQVGSWNNSYNWVDVFPPSGKSMANLVAFIPSIAVIHYAGGVNGDDSMRCTWANLGDRIRIWVQNTEQRSTPAANWLAVWS